MAGGVGITPIIAAARKLTELGVRYDMHWHKLPDSLEKKILGAQNVYVATDDGSKGYQGLCNSSWKAPRRCLGCHLRSDLVTAKHSTNNVALPGFYGYDELRLWRIQLTMSHLLRRLAVCLHGWTCL